MKRIIGVRFRTAGKIYYFSPGDLPIRRGNHVIVETARGVEYGLVVGDPMELEDKKVPQPLKTVLRLATPEDEEHERANRDKEREAFRVCLSKIRRHDLEMKLIDAEYTFDNSKILFYFTADGRVDFRELVKDLAGVFRTRIELRQIGVRDETKILGGIGICGRALCCHSYLSDFIPVSIKMAKEQNLSLNPAKISGVCGRLMCCLKNEEETYEELNRNLPGIGDEVESDDGLHGEVESVNVLRQTVKIIVEVDDEKELHEYGVEHLTVLRKRRRGASRSGSGGGKKEKNRDSQENRELEKLEKEEKQGENREERAGERHGERREERAGERRADRREERAGERRTDRRDERQDERRGDRRDERQDERRGDRRDERAGERRGDHREERAGERRADRRGERMGERRGDRREERAGERHGDHREESAADRHGEHGKDRQSERRTDRREERTGERRGDHREGRRSGRGMEHRQRPQGQEHGGEQETAPGKSEDAQE